MVSGLSHDVQREVLAKSNVNIESTKERYNIRFPVSLAHFESHPAKGKPAIAACLVWLHISPTQPHISSDQGEKLVVIERISNDED